MFVSTYNNALTPRSVFKAFAATALAAAFFYFFSGVPAVVLSISFSIGLVVIMMIDQEKDVAWAQALAFSLSLGLLMESGGYLSENSPLGILFGFAGVCFLAMYAWFGEIGLGPCSLSFNIARPLSSDVKTDWFGATILVTVIPMLCLLVSALEYYPARIALALMAFGAASLARMNAFPRACRTLSALCFACSAGVGTFVAPSGWIVATLGGLAITIAVIVNLVEQSAYRKHFNPHR